MGARYLGEQILKEAKLEYRTTFGDLKELKDAISTLEDTLTSTRQQLVSSKQLPRPLDRFADIRSADSGAQPGYSDEKVANRTNRDWVGEQLTRPFRHALRFLSTQL